MQKRLLVIGLPKAGTTTLHRALTCAGIQSAHYTYNKRFVGSWMVDDFTSGVDPLLHLPAAVTQCDVVAKGVCLWPQMNFEILRRVRKHHPRLLLLLNTRNLDAWLRSVSGWGNYRRMLIDADVPYLPKGRGGDDAELKRWADNHYNRCRDLFGRDPHFLELSVTDDKHARDKLSEALQVRLPWWGVTNTSAQWRWQQEMSRWLRERRALAKRGLLTESKAGSFDA